MEADNDTDPDGNAVLKGVIAFVEVRSSNDNRSAAIAHELTQLGARVEGTFSDAVTHVVYKEGLKRTWSRATKRRVPMVSVSWLDSCKQHRKRMPEADFPAILPEESNSPLLRVNQPIRWKKMRSMQPCDFDEELARSAERGEKRRKRVMMANRFKLAEEATPTSSPIPILAMETQPRSPMFGMLSQTSSPIPDTPPSMKERLERMRREQMQVLLDDSPTKTPKLDSAKPLQKRLFERLAFDFASTGTSSEEERDSTSTLVRQLIHRLDSDESKGGNQSQKPESGQRLAEGWENRLPALADGVASSEVSTGTEAKPSIPNAGQNRRRSLRVSTASPSRRSMQFVPGASQNSGKESSHSLRFSQSDSGLDQSKVPQASTSPERFSLALSPKDVNVSTPVETDLQADLPPKPNHPGPDAVKHRHSDQEGAAKGDNENSFPSNGVVNRRRSCRVISKVSNSSNAAQSERPSKTSVKDAQSNPMSIEIKSNPMSMETKSNPMLKEINKPRSSPISPALLKPKLTKKKRNLFTEPAFDSSLIKPSGAKSNASPVAVTAASDVAFLFGTSGKVKSATTSKLSKTSKTSSDSSLKGQREGKSPGQKSLCGSRSEETALNNDTLGTSMSVMYGNDTTLPGEKTSLNSRRSIDEFNLSKQPLRKPKSLKSAVKSKLEQISESGGRATNSGAGHAASKCPGKPRGPDRKRCRDASPSGDSTEACRPEAAKKQRCLSSGESDGKVVSSPAELGEARPRLRHARSLVMEPAAPAAAGKARYSLVVTSLHREEQELVYSVVKKLGVFHLSNTVDASSTHVVCGEPRRTLNLLRAVARGCWVLSKEWVFKSVEAGCWMAEEDYEMEEDLPVVKRSRLARQEVGSDYRVYLFSHVGPVYVSGECKPPRKDLVHLLQLCSGSVTTAQSRASVCVGEVGESDRTVIRPTWLLDSIMQLECLPFEDYVLSPPRTTYSQRESSPEF